MTIKINMDNAAFEDYASEETARILREMADQVEKNHHFSPGFSIPARDINGNECGFLSVKN